MLPSLRQLGGEVEWTDISVIHSGADRTPEGRNRKYERDVRILGQELEARPEHPFVLFNLGMTHADMDDHEAAIDYLERSIAASSQSDSHLRKTYALLVSSLEQCRRIVEACEACHRGLEALPDDAEREHFSSVDPGIASYKARHNLGLVYEDMGRADLAEVQWRNSRVNGSQFAPSRRAMIERMLQQRRLETARIEIDGMLCESTLRCDGLLLEGMLQETLGNIQVATRCLCGIKGSG